jgi:hypothetical protein
MMTFIVDKHFYFTIKTSLWDEIVDSKGIFTENKNSLEIEKDKPEIPNESSDEKDIAMFAKSNGYEDHNKNTISLNNQNSVIKSSHSIRSSNDSKVSQSPLVQKRKINSTMRANIIARINMDLDDMFKNAVEKSGASWKYGIHIKNEPHINGKRGDSIERNKRLEEELEELYRSILNKKKFVR